MLQKPLLVRSPDKNIILGYFGDFMLSKWQFSSPDYSAKKLKNEKGMC
jgi:hypothetical protein